jgi:hypothetical protein
MHTLTIAFAEWLPAYLAGAMVMAGGLAVALHMAGPWQRYIGAHR